MRKRNVRAKSTTVDGYLLSDDGTFPNNDILPTLVYRTALPFTRHDEHVGVRNVFEENGWTHVWVDGMFGFHHYHSTSHEVLGIARGQVSVEIGGPSKGVVVELNQGDVLLLPAGVAHRKTEGSRDLTVVGAYPPGQEYDMNYGLVDERTGATQTIRGVAIPTTDPVLGLTGPLMKHWRRIQ